MRKVIDYIGKVEKDKLLHLLCSLILAFVIGKVNWYIGWLPLWNCAAIGGIAAFCLGVLKEVLDEFMGGELDLKDLAFDFIGCLIGVIMTGV